MRFAPFNNLRVSSHFFTVSDWLGGWDKCEGAFSREEAQIYGITTSGCGSNCYVKRAANGGEAYVWCFGIRGCCVTQRALADKNSQFLPLGENIFRLRGFSYLKDHSHQRRTEQTNCMAAIRHEFHKLPFFWLGFAAPECPCVSLWGAEASFKPNIVRKSSLCQGFFEKKKSKLWIHGWIANALSDVWDN